MIKMKKKMSTNQEFEIMKLVLDKFLWLGFGVMAYGVFQMITNTITDGLYYLITGIVLLILFVVIIVKEYQVLR